MKFNKKNLWTGLLVAGLIFSFPIYIYFNNLVELLALTLNGSHRFDFKENGYPCTFGLSSKETMVAIVFVILRLLIIFGIFWVFKRTNWGLLFALVAVSFLYFDILFFCFGGMHMEIRSAFFSLYQMQQLSHSVFNNVYILPALSLVPAAYLYSQIRKKANKIAMKLELFVPPVSLILYLLLFNYFILKK